MTEIGMNSLAFQQILAGQKKIEGRLATERFLSFKPGDHVTLREDVWQHGKIVKSVNTKTTIVITRVDRFVSFREMLGTLDFQQIIVSAKTVDEAAKRYRQFYSEADEEREGVVAISFDLLK